MKQKELAGGVIFWECSNRRNDRSCGPKVKINNDIFVECCSAFQNPADVAILMTRIPMTTQAQTSDDQTQAIIGANTPSIVRGIESKSAKS